MYEVPDYEEIFGSDPNDAKHFEPKGSAPKVYTGPKLNRWFVMGCVGDSTTQKPMILKVTDKGMYWFRPSANASGFTDAITLFTSVKEADQAVTAAQELFPELTVWLSGLTVKE